MIEYSIDKETAEDEFYRFCDAWNLDYDTSEMSEEDRDAFLKIKRCFIKAVRQKWLTLNDDGTLTYIFSKFSEKLEGQEIIIKRPKGHSYMDMDGFKSGQTIRQTYAVLASMTGKQVRFFSNVDGVDLKPLQAIITLFLAE